MQPFYHPLVNVEAAAHRERSLILSAAGDNEAAAEAGLQALEADPEAPELRRWAAVLLRLSREPLPQRYLGLLHGLLVDPAIAPRSVARACWRLLEGSDGFPDFDDPEAAVHWLEGNEFVLAALGETIVALLHIERRFTALRRWLLLSGRAAEFPRSCAALVRQAGHNAGAWLFGDEERARLPNAGPLREAYLPPHPDTPPPAFVSPITNAVAAQYDRWPYPPPDRQMGERVQPVAEAIAALGPPGRQDMPEDARLLVAGCGSGRQPLSWALRHPRLRITAIDISAGAVARAKALAEKAGVRNIDFRLLDLQEAESLGQRFDLISSTGVLHHLADPEGGWEKLVHVLRPGGVMQLMLYSRIARLPVRAAQARVADLRGKPVDDDLLRDIRRRVLEGPETCVTTSMDFFHLGGVHDMLFHVREDSFDVPRIRRAIERFGLDFLGFRLPTRAHRTRYRAEHPGDPWFRDYDAWARLEHRDPLLFIGTYEFWCGKPDAAE